MDKATAGCAAGAAFPAPPIVFISIVAAILRFLSAGGSPRAGQYNFAWDAAIGTCLGDRRSEPVGGDRILSLGGSGWQTGSRESSR